MSAYMGKLLYIDLSSGKSKEIELNPELAKHYVGGKGFGAKILYDLLPAGTDPLSPQNILMFMSGPLTGTLAPAMRGCVVTKSPLTGTFADSYFGGHFAQEIRYCGYDGIIIAGAAAEPSYIWIDNGKVEIRSAEGIWGLETFEAVDVIRDEIGDDTVKTAIIGPAGENKVSFALINCEYNRHAGRAGTGAVMGSKNLKALVLHGKKSVKPADAQAFSTAVDQAYKELAEDETIAGFTTDGTPASIDFANDEQLLPTNNYYNGIFEGAAGLNAEAQRKHFWFRNVACAGCPIACGKVGKIGTGRHRGLISDVVEYETASMIGSNLGLSNIREVAYLVKKCDSLGLDGMSAGGVAGFAIEAYQKGLITSDDTGGLELKFGDVASADFLLDAIASRKGIGDILARGVQEAAKALGDNAADFAVHVKGLESPAWGPRSVPGMGLALATADRGGCHQRAFPILYECGGEWNGEPVDRLGLKGKGEIVAHLQNYLAAVDTFVKCDFATYGITKETYAAMLAAAVGEEYDVEKLIKLGERVWNQIRLFNLREGFTRADDTLPRRFTEEPLPEGPYAGARISLDDLDHLLDEYYGVRGWDKEGKPTEAKLKELGLDNMPTLVERPIV
ncbi:MAG: aldehyde ferredoxin oxidoreductase family protein [Bacillota bacterium]|nr:aldehyde ferredoxin oxidoreductase family protein [Bacillota bacterium]